MLGLVVCAGCMTLHESMMQQYGGQNKAYLLGRQGPPDMKEPDGQGGEIWIYRTEDVYETPEREQTTVGTNYKDEPTVTREKSTAKTSVTIRFRSFYINKAGIIYDFASGSRRVVQ